VSTRVSQAEPPPTLAGTVAVVGFPNVGKSTLVNRLTSSRQAVVHETPGVTRDRKELVCEWNGRSFLLVDTGGVDIVDPSPITRSIVEQARSAVAEADLILFVTDAQIGVTPGDEELAAILRSAHKPVLLLANKVDDPTREGEAYDFYRLGLGDPIPVSGLHGHGTGDLLDLVVARLPGEGRAALGEEAIGVAILGRPNVGKSSLLNAILGQDRVIVSDVPGTTRDAIDTPFRRGERDFLLVDTAGLRRHRRQRQGIEYYSELRALQAAERADVALVLVDAAEGVVDQDLSVADVARKAHCATVVVLNKWDISEVTIDDVRRRLEPRIRQRPPVLAVSALSGRGIGRLLDRIEALFERSSTRIPTAELNRFLRQLREDREPPGRGRKRLNLLYGTQITVRPPRFRLAVNDPSLVTRDYGYWVENRLRERFEMEGVPVDIDFVRRS
jgi:GTPase